LQHQRLTRDQLLIKIGAAKKDAGRAYFLVEIQLPEKNQPVTPETFIFSLRRDKLRKIRRQEGNYLLRTNLKGSNPAELWRHYIQLTEIEQAFKELKGDLAIRPIYHQLDHRIEAHIFIAFVAYCLQVALKQRLSFAAKLKCEVVELNVQNDHVHLLVMIPPKVSVSDFVGTVKGRTAIRIFNKFRNLKHKPYWGNHFWARGYCVDTVGLDEEKILKYVKHQEDKEKTQEERDKRH
jgi:REP element-mobilizing transposase RayT